jgi:ABC-type multidrug transport system fused ATPase/permease subunit
MFVYEGGNEEDLLMIHSSHYYYHLMILTALGIFTDIFRHEFTLLLISLSLLIVGYLWIDFFGIGNLELLQIIELLLLGSMDLTFLIRSYIVERIRKKSLPVESNKKEEERGWELVDNEVNGSDEEEEGNPMDEESKLMSPKRSQSRRVQNQTEVQTSKTESTTEGWNKEENEEINQNISIGKWIIRFYFFQSIVSLLINNSYFNSYFIPSTNKILFKEIDPTWHAGYYPLVIGAVFSALFLYIFCGSVVLMILKWFARPSNKSKLQDYALNSTLSASSCSSSSSTSAWNCIISYLKVCIQLSLCFILSYTFQIAFFLYSQCIPIFLFYKFEISTDLYEMIYNIGCFFSLLQLLLLERIASQPNSNFVFSSYETMIMSCLIFLIIIWMMIESERISLFFYAYLYPEEAHQLNIQAAYSHSHTYMPQTYPKEFQKPEETIKIENKKYSFFEMIELILFIFSMILLNSFVFICNNVANLIAFSCIKLPTVSVCDSCFTCGSGSVSSSVSGNGSGLESKWAAFWNSCMEWFNWFNFQYFSSFQARYVVITLAAHKTAEMIFQYHEITVTINEKKEMIIEEGDIREVLNNDDKLLLWILLCLSIHFLLLCCFQSIFDGIFLPFSFNTWKSWKNELFSKKVSFKRLFGILIGIAGICYFLVNYNESF